MGAGPRNLSQSSPAGAGPSGECPIDLRRLKQRPRAMYTLPTPEKPTPFANLVNWVTCREPICTIRWYLRAA